ncbi:hypothetical protein [Archangium violaceum]|uniref:DUF2357 domain-containing protein n=1 Tax=Archangium violaceum Cb vi76 TaxID=1406225 RepID=A0A084SPD7_9BACT|nr:hypothetical protein [Archangium violaceum]KFA90322.1 hypothetical protein Q664_29355 [Archangium violaceum Cb vi76]
MSAAYHNRLTGADLPAPPDPTPLFGLWQVVTPGPGDCFLNSVPVTSGDFLVPDASGRWTLTEALSGQRRDGSFGKYLIPEELEAYSVKSMGERLRPLLEGGQTWLDWLDVTPVTPGMSEQVELQRLDRAIDEHLGHLKQVCLRPRMHLRVDIEKTPVDRARRIPPQATTYLATHSEDWERRTLRAVHPKRIQALVRDDLVDIYENRISARLVDHLLDYVRKRMHDVRKLRRVFEKTKDYEAQALAGSHWRQKRVCGLWGKAVDADERRRRADATLQELERLRYALLGLMSSALYKGIPRRAQVGNLLSLTNILRNDIHYRHVATLWREWAAYRQTQVRSPGEVYQGHQRVCRSFDAFCLLLVIRALDQLGYMPQDPEASLRPGEPIVLEGPGEKVQLRWDEEGVISLSTSHEQWRIVPLPASISASPDAEVARRHLETMAQAGPGDGTSSTLVLHLAGSSGEERLEPEVLQRLHTLGNDLKKAERRGPGMLPVAPWDIGSVERVVRALRWALNASRFLRYPARVEAPLPEGLPVGHAQGWLQLHDKKVVVMRPPAQHERVAFEPAEVVRTLESRHQQLKARHLQSTEAAREASKRGSRTSSLNQEKSESNAAVMRAQEELERAKAFQVALEEAIRLVDGLRHCPTCPAQVEPQHGFQARPGGDFHCECADCRTSWGTQACGACRGRFPFLLPAMKGWSGREPAPGWVDQVLGGDVLAVPCARSSEPGTFICSACGACSCAECRAAEKRSIRIEPRP